MAGIRMTLGVLAVLGALLDRPDTEQYGLEIVRASGLEPGTIYPILQRLRGAGWVTDRWEDPAPGRSEGRPPRRYYRLTVEGRARAVHALQHGRDRSGLSRLLAPPSHRVTPTIEGGLTMIGTSGPVGDVQPAMARPREDAASAARSLRWVRGLLPGEESTAWWAEVISCLAETPDPGERRRYLRSYRQSVPQLVWTSWTSSVRSAKPALVALGCSSVNRKVMNLALPGAEDKFGIKLQSKPGPRTTDQKYSVLLGIVVIVLGIIGFLQTGFVGYTGMTDHSILGVFATNGFHNTVYLIIGLFWLLGAFTLTPAGNQGMNIGVGAAFLIVAVLGFMGYWALLAIPAGVNADNILDLVVAVASLIVGGGVLSAGASRPDTEPLPLGMHRLT